jgi:hypothetical protein
MSSTPNKKRSDSGGELARAPLDPQQSGESDKPAPSNLDPANVLQAVYGNAAVARKLVQRKADDGGSEVPAVAPPVTAPPAAAAAPSSETPAAEGPTAEPSSIFIVDDTAEALLPGQMRRTEFLAQLRAGVCDAAAEALAGTRWSEEGCPYIVQAFDRYAQLDSRRLEQGIRRYAPEAGSVTSAAGLIPLVAGRVRSSLTTWVETGQVVGVPPGMQGPGMPGAVGGAVSAVAGAAARVGGAVAGVGRMLLKGRGGDAGEAGDPAAVLGQLGAGQSLDGGVKSRMESAFGQSFGDVRVHADARGAEMSEGLRARAFTVGEDVAFGAGEYRPGTMVGDALIAHELAHVVQQRGVGAATDPATKATGAQSGLEEDADRAAVGAVVSTWSGARRGLAKVAGSVLPSLKSGLRLQRCKSEPSPIPPPVKGQTYEEWLRTFPGFNGNRDIVGAAPADLRGWIVGDLGVPPDCADVSMALRHYYLKSQEKTFTFKAGPKKKEFKIGFGVTDAQLRDAMIGVGSINVQEDRPGFRMIKYYKKGGSMIHNLKRLIEAGLKPGDVMVFKKLPGEPGNYEGHVQTVQAIDVSRGLLTVVQGNMEGGSGTGELQQRQYTFKNRTGVDDGDADIKDQNVEQFYGAGAWME